MYTRTTIVPFLFRGGPIINLPLYKNVTSKMCACECDFVLVLGLADPRGTEICKASNACTMQGVLLPPLPNNCVVVSTTVPQLLDESGYNS
jgi:hypothetical protein